MATAYTPAARPSATRDPDTGRTPAEDFTIGQPTGIHVVVVGAGIGGLAAAIESRRKGHEVTVVEKFTTPLRLGDALGIMPNAGRLLYRWGRSFHATLDSMCGHSIGFQALKWDLTQIAPRPLQTWEGGVYPGPPAPLYDAHRGDLHLQMFELARDIGCTFRLGEQVTRYFERSPPKSSKGEEGAKACAGVTLSTGEEIVGDVVIGADGVRSKAREAVLGFEDRPKSSGYAVFRAYFDSDQVAKDPLTAHWVLSDGRDQRTLVLAPDTHFIVSTLKGGKELSWVLTHKDDADIIESWNLPGRNEDALKVVEGWHPAVRAVISHTPPGRCVDWKLCFRDPLPTFISPEARICLIGDAAHPFLPTSIQGASQAIEDAVCIAATLALAGKYNISAAVRAFEKIRYGRATETQALGVKNREAWHKLDWSKPIDPQAISILHPAWVLDYDVEKDTIQLWNAGLNQLLAKGSPCDRRGRGTSGTNVGAIGP